MEEPAAGQRWVSDSEPELGLGIILKTSFGRVEVLFPAANEHRQYALKTSPLRRVRFKEGDHVKSHDGADLVVESLTETNGLITYHTDKQDLPEAGLSDAISFSTPEDRMLTGQVDDLRTFDLRVQALQQRSQLRHSPVRGYVGGRVDLIPHQMYIASEVASRLVPRVLLADEVGLGKTIEAGLILHRLHLTGRADRILILVPEPLIHQWFVELLRKFNLMFSLFDEERCESIERIHEDTNPFLDSQLVICSVDYLANNPKRAQQVTDAAWDLLVVDEAHHLEWSPALASPQYTLVESIAGKAKALLLLTATPQQLGPEGHFARLRLLDPDRYTSLEQFTEETQHYEEVAQAVDRLLMKKPMSKDDQQLFGKKSARIRQQFDELKGGSEAARERLVSELLDEFGTGRVMFRNTRTALSGFPERKAKLHEIKVAPEADVLEQKVKWLVKLLKELGEEKVLLICRTKELVEQIHEQLQHEVNINCTLFHEELTLLQRDRNAAYFSEEDGARILLCSEIGSEGRNFQFAHHLVLFDLPTNPELLEQRIGRLDRIGQTSTIHIHAPYLKGTDSEVLAKWYHSGLNAFEKNLHGASDVLKALEGSLSELMGSFDAKKLTAFLKESKAIREQIGKKMERGHDRLLELNSCKPDQAEQTIQFIREHDSDTDFEEFLVSLLDHFGMHIEDLGQRSYLLMPGNLITNGLPAMPDEGMSVTFDRKRALSREDVGFMSGDHPLVRGGLDLLLGDVSGNSAFGIWKGAGEESLLLELYFVAECIAPSVLHVDRFLSATPIRIVVDHSMADQTHDGALMNAKLIKGDINKLLDRGVVKKKIIPGMLTKAKALAEQEMTALVATATALLNSQLDLEIERLSDLQEINDHVQPDDVDALKQHKAELEAAIGSARVRLDAVRLIWKML